MYHVCSQAGDVNTPNILAGKAGLHSGARTGPPTGTAFPNMLLPPLDRLDQNHYGGTPTPSAATGGPGFVSGATPSQFAVTGAAGPTPGPRLGEWLPATGASDMLPLAATHVHFARKL